MGGRLEGYVPATSTATAIVTATAARDRENGILAERQGSKSDETWAIKCRSEVEMVQNEEILWWKHVKPRTTISCIAYVAFLLWNERNGSEMESHSARTNGIHQRTKWESIKEAMKLYSKHDCADTTWILCYTMNISRMTLSCKHDIWSKCF